MFLPLIIAAAIAVSSSIGIYQADKALPGDALYPVKIHFNENMKHISAVGAAAEAKVSAELIARRAEETRTLSAEGRLDAQAKATLSQEMRSEVEAWYENTNKLSADGNATAQADAKTTIDMYSRTYGDVFQMLNVSLTDSSNTEISGSASGTTNTNMNGSNNSGLYVDGSTQSTTSVDTTVSPTLEIKENVNINLGDGY
jgi:hypothetical protein